MQAAFDLLLHKLERTITKVALRKFPFPTLHVHIESLLVGSIKFADEFIKFLQARQFLVDKGQACLLMASLFVDEEAAQALKFIPAIAGRPRKECTPLACFS